MVYFYERYVIGSFSDQTFQTGSPMNSPKISIITPSLNRAGMISSAIESVLAQNYPAFEHIIVDGGSTDGTLELLNKYNHLNLIIEKDSGMYNALNRGIAHANGDIICFLNSDDRFLLASFSQVIAQFERKNADAVIGQAIMVSDMDMSRQKIISVQPEHWWETLILGIPIFNAWFFRRVVFGELGEFDTRFKIAGDRDLLIRFGLANFKPAFTDQPLYEYKVHEGSLSLGRRPSNVYRMCTENLWLVEKWQKRASNPPQVDPLLQQLAMREIAEMVIQAIKDRSVGKVFSYIQLGRKREPAFLSFLVKKIIRGVGSKLTRRPLL
jgi:glycosyltransferase involved in cell wall biosynthesis